MLSTNVMIEGMASVYCFFFSVFKIKKSNLIATFRVNALINKVIIKLCVG